MYTYSRGIIDGAFLCAVLLLLIGIFRPMFKSLRRRRYRETYETEDLEPRATVTARVIILTDQNADNLERKIETYLNDKNFRFNNPQFAVISNGTGLLHICYLHCEVWEYPEETEKEGADV